MLRRLSLFLLLALAMQCAGAERIKDLVTIAGVRNNQLVGYGLVVGLTGTGDQTTQTPFTVKSLKSMLSNLGVTIPPEVNLQLKNVAAVSLQAELPPFAKPGQTIDVTVSSIGNAKSLRGGSLMMAPLKGVDGAIYAIAQGNVVVGGLGAEAGESKITINVPSAGRIPNGATVERQVPDTFGKEGPIVLNLRQADFTTAERIVEAVNKTLGGDVAQAIDATSIQVRGPAERNQRVSLISVLENIEVVPAQTAAKVIVNSRTGTIVIGQNVKVGPAAVSHGNMTVTIAADPKVSQPAPLSRGQTVVVPNATIAVDQEKKP
ncbi:MAG TPA: flagellar biosynthesis protein FlgI, partial [Candidatus Competibacteraceae bacterium]|nr:flagellar biosynthesis protein FlgI [Candidatus Competibacteraceae bacterium]